MVPAVPPTSPMVNDWPLNVKVPLFSDRMVLPFFNAKVKPVAASLLGATCGSQSVARNSPDCPLLLLPTNTISFAPA